MLTTLFKQNLRTPQSLLDGENIADLQKKTLCEIVVKLWNSASQEKKKNTRCMEKRWEDSLSARKQSIVTSQYPFPLFLWCSEESDQIWIKNKMPKAFSMRPSECMDCTRGTHLPGDIWWNRILLDGIIYSAPHTALCIPASNTFYWKSGHAITYLFPELESEETALSPCCKIRWTTAQKKRPLWKVIVGCAWIYIKIVLETCLQYE